MPNATEEVYDVVGNIMEYEDGTLDDEATQALFEHLVKSGAIYSLQGHYQRQAVAMGLIASPAVE